MSSAAMMESPRPRAWAVLRAMRAESPVIILMSTPAAIAASSVAFVSGLGGSRNVSRPANRHGAAFAASTEGASAVRATAMHLTPRAA